MYRSCDEIDLERLRDVLLGEVIQSVEFSDRGDEGYVLTTLKGSVSFCWSDGYGEYELEGGNNDGE